jgi:CheY-like chemotaxis protein
MPQEKHILVAEDDADLRKLIVLSLRGLGQIFEVGNGADALKWLRENGPPDLFVTDLMMPGLDGLSLSRLIKRDEKLARLPIIVLTAKDSPKDVVEGINAGARHYLTKPFKRDELVEKAKKLLRL